MPTIAEILARELDKPLAHVQNVIDLLDQGNTIPFIARYRKEVALYEKAVARRPNTYLPKLAEAQHELGKFYWWRHTPASYRMALKLFMLALRNYDRYRGRRNLTLGRLYLLDDLAKLSVRLDGRSAEQVTEFLRDVIQPVLDANAEDVGQHVELNV